MTSSSSTPRKRTKRTAPSKRPHVAPEPAPEVQPKTSGDYTSPPKDKPLPKYRALRGSRGTAGSQQSALEVSYQPPPPPEKNPPTPVVLSDRPVERELFAGGRIVSIHELAAMFQISTRTLWRRVVQQEWPRIPLGRNVRFDLELVLRHIERVERYDQPPPLRGITLVFDAVFPALEGSHTYMVRGESFVFPGKYVELRSIGELVSSEPPRWVDVEVWADERVLAALPPHLHAHVLSSPHPTHEHIHDHTPEGFLHDTETPLTERLEQESASPPSLFLPPSSKENNP